jgi:plastocyanin
MNRTIRVTALALTGLSLLAASVALSLPPGGGTAVAATQTVAVQTTPLQFSPSTLTISVGDTVQWDWPAGNTVAHTVTSDPPAADFDSGIVGEGNFLHTFAVAGTYHYYCDVHPVQMTGTITVQAAPTATSTVAATNTAAPTATRTATPVATGTAAASATPIITPTHTSGIAPTVIAPAPPVAPAPSGGAAGAAGLPRAGTGGAAEASPLPLVSVALAMCGLLAIAGAALTWRRA